MVDRVGQYIDDYRLVRRLGAGAFGEVYLGEHVRDQSQIAVKMLYLTQESLKGFIKEASTAFRLRHPHIVQLLSFGISADDTPYLIMAYASNGTLRERHPKGTRLAVNTVISYLLPLASALQYAHDRRVVHRDVKPENVLIGPDGKVLLSDFGIAVIAPVDRSLSTQNLGGTAPYMAPEQIRGKPQPASDQYALGIMVYEWLCGVRPFEGNQWEILEQQHSSPPPPLREKLPDIPRQAEEIIFKALAKNPQDRFASVQDFATTLAGVSQTNLFSFPTSTPLRSPPPLHLVLPPSTNSSENPLILYPSPAPPPENTATHSPRQENFVEPGASTIASSPPPFSLRTDIPSAWLSVPPTTVQGGTRFSSIPVSPPSQSTPTSPLLPKDHRRVAPGKLFLFLGLLFLLVGGSIGVYYTTTSTWLGNTSHTSTQANTTVTAQVNVPGRTWHVQNSGISIPLTAVVWSGSLFVAVGVYGNILTSPDGRTWIAQPSVSATVLLDIAWSGSLFVAVGSTDSGSAIILTSPNGRTWMAKYSVSWPNLNGVTWSGSQFVVVGGGDIKTPSSSFILTSPDGNTWTAQSSPTSQALYDVVWSGSQFVVVGDSGTILTSPNGRIWMAQPSGIKAGLHGVVWSGSQFVAVGDGSTIFTSPNGRGAIFTSPNGRNWSAQPSGTSQFLQGVAWSGSLFVAVGESGTILTSPDGRTWTARLSDASPNLNSVVWSGSRSEFVIMGDVGTILTSP